MHLHQLQYLETPVLPALELMDTQPDKKPVPKAAMLARLISTKPGLKTINDPINPVITAAHLLNPTFSPNNIGDKMVTIKGAIKANVRALDKEIIDIE